MKKLSLTLIAIAALCSGQANATPINWQLDGANLLPAGSFTYDADTNAYSNVAILGELLGVFTSGSGTSTRLNMSCCLGANSLTLFFASALTNAGGNIAYRSSESALWGIVRASDSGVVNSVPEPGSMLLLGAGLVGLGLLRRRKQSV